MAQHDYIIANQSGAAFRSDLNNGLAAIVSQNSGAAQPSTTYAYQWWSDTTTGLLKLRNAANNAWITVGTLADANLGLLSLAGGTLTGALLVDDSGTAALPAIAFDGDTNTGIFRPGADQFGIATNGVERVEFGTTEVVFNDGGEDVDFRVEGDTNADLFKVDAGLDQVQVANLNGGPLAGFRNRIINGNFDFWQRGTSFTANEYGADRWIHNRVGTTHTATRQPFTLGQTDVPGEPTYFCRTVVSSVAGAANFSVLAQYIEDVRTFAGQQVTISFWAKVDSTKNISIALSQNFGTGGSPSATVAAIGTTKISIGTSWQKVTVTATVPSISGKTIGTSNNSFLQLNIFFDAGSDYNARTDSLGQQSGTFEIAQVQLEPGPVATPFEQRPIGTELALCQRYYEKSYEIGTSPGTSTDVGVTITRRTGAEGQTVFPAMFQAEKRGTPTITWYSPFNGLSARIYDLILASNVVVTGAAPNYPASTKGPGGPAHAASGSLSNLIQAHWTASSEL
jgi:hypothetical protein